MKKCLLGLMLGLIALPALASPVKYLFQPPIDVQIVTKTDPIGNSYKVIQITISHLDDFNGDHFEFTVNAVGTAIEVKGKSHRRRDPVTGKLARNENNKHYRHVIKQIIQLPASIPASLWGKHKSYNNNSKYFSYYNHKTDNTLVITIPVAEYIATDSDVAVIE